MDPTARKKGHSWKDRKTGGVELDAEMLNMLTPIYSHASDSAFLVSCGTCQVMPVIRFTNYPLSISRLTFNKVFFFSLKLNIKSKFVYTFDILETPTIIKEITEQN